ncbi:hypothetical protein MAR_010360 [Mya arenaria]|uniref:Uncharacterized protein n=1 Tax=Mya arenaria TaxID=6604 RepID=A0ABY7E1D1_MYAAR|nr:hypothetical protein MAR_010360 [Mya arenaria]
MSILNRGRLKSACTHQAEPPIPEHSRRQWLVTGSPPFCGPRVLKAPIVVAVRVITEVFPLWVWGG